MVRSEVFTSRITYILDGLMLLAQANSFCALLEPGSDDKINMSWIERFKQRHGIVRIKKSGESSGVDVEVVRVWKEGKLVEVLEKYSPKDVFNADETSLFWLILPDNSLGYAGQSHHGSKQSKQRITILVSSDMDGSEKLPLFVIGKSMKYEAKSFQECKSPCRVYR